MHILLNALFVLKGSARLKLILGIGQSLRGDDGAGLAAVKLWQSRFPARAADSDLRVESLELPGLALLDYFVAVDKVLLVDAVRSGAAAGTLHWLGEADLAGFCLGSGSAHGWGVAETLALGRQVQPENMPNHLTILGIEARELDLGEGLSPEVAGVMDQAAKMIEQWASEAGDKGEGIGGRIFSNPPM